MNLRNKRKIVARILKVGIDRVWFDPGRASDIQQAITKDDFRKLISEGAVLVKQKKGVSRGRARARLLQKRKGRQSGSGSRKGAKTSRLSRKTLWVKGIRAQRELFSNLVQKKSITDDVYRHLRKKAKGGFFRSRRHVKTYLTENKMWAGKK